MPKIIPINDLEDIAAISEMCHISPEPVFITKEGHGDMAIMSTRVYEEKFHKSDVYGRFEDDCILHSIPIENLKDAVTTSQMCHESPEPFYVTQNGYNSMVIMNIKYYNIKMLQLDFDRKLEEAEEEFRQGKGVNARTALAEIRKEYGL